MLRKLITNKQSIVTRSRISSNYFACSWFSLRNQNSFSTVSVTASATVQLPSHTKVVVIGGGIIGTSVAYHLAKLGCKDVVLLEQAQLTAGTTWHAAGLMVTFGSLSETATEIRKYTRDLYSNLEAETGHSTGFKPIGKKEFIV